MFRQVARDVHISDVEIGAGSIVFLSTAATHYDEEVYPSPETFDIEREFNHLAFGFGPHYCIGAPLARLEARIGLSMLVERFPEIHLDPDEQLRFFHVSESALFGAETIRVVLGVPATSGFVRGVSPAEDRRPGECPGRPASGGIPG